ncbi:MAG: hypothetical protein KGN76_01050 [Acidobacteriota bacterium]|nr:hypothetical protein [Acidobacteriota bacterium]
MKVLKAAVLVGGGVVLTLGLQAAVRNGTVPLRAQESQPPPAAQTAPSANPIYVPGPAAVTVLNQPTVNAKQQGEWTVRLDQAPVLEVAPVQVAPPAFVRPGGKYAFTWAPGAKAEVHTVLAVGQGGWMLVSGQADRPGSVWVNTARAIRIEQVE